MSVFIEAALSHSVKAPLSVDDVNVGKALEVDRQSAADRGEKAEAKNVDGGKRFLPSSSSSYTAVLRNVRNKGAPSCPAGCFPSVYVCFRQALKVNPFRVISLFVLLVMKQIKLKKIFFCCAAHRSHRPPDG